ncbi:MAG: lipoate--protein ligase [Spirochaetales bacterium]|nr:lipoate--protein ligase [Spirochaetales bacterium]
MKRAIYVATSHDCAANLAGEAYLMGLDHDRTLYLWENDPCIVIGRFQNPWAECNLAKMEEDGVRLVRRQSGGGAVYHDRGNLIFTFIGDKGTASRVENFDLLLTALANIGLKCELSGRNDITMDGKKISGNAFQNTATKFCHHGTLLVRGNLLVMGDYLTPSSTKLASKAVKSVASRVGNLSEGRSDVTNDMVKEALIAEFNRRYGHTEPVEMDFTSLPEAQANYHRFGDYEQILKKSPPFTHAIEHRFDWGEVTMQLQVEESVIADVHIYTDALDTSIVERTTLLLAGIPYTAEAALDRSERTDDGPTKELLAYLASQI